MEQGNGRVIVLVDYDNFEICARRDLGLPADLAPVVRYSQTLGTVVSARAYGSWDDAQLRMAVYRTGIEPAFAPVFPSTGYQPGEGKSVADTALVADGIDLLHLLRPEVLVVVSSDKDLMPLVRMAKLRGVHVVVVGSDLTAAQLTASADRMVTYRELVGGPPRRGEPMAPAPYQQTISQPPLRPAPILRAGRPAPSAPPAVAPVAPVVAPSAAPAADTTTESTTQAGKRRRCRRRGRGGADGAVPAELDVLDVAEEIEDETEDLAAEPDAVDEAEVRPPPAAPEIVRPPLPQRRDLQRPPTSETGGRTLPFRRQGFQTPGPRVPEVEVQPREPVVPTFEPVADPIPAVETPMVTDGEVAGTELRRTEPPVGPVRVVSAPPPPSEPEETAGRAPALPDEPEQPLLRPSLDQLIGRVVSKVGDEPRRPEAMPVVTAVEARDPEPEAALPPADSSRRRRRRRPDRPDGDQDPVAVSEEAVAESSIPVADPSPPEAATASAAAELDTPATSDGGAQESTPTEASDSPSRRRRSRSRAKPPEESAVPTADTVSDAVAEIASDPKPVAAEPSASIEGVIEAEVESGEPSGADPEPTTPANRRRRRRPAKEASPAESD